ERRDVHVAGVLDARQYAYTLEHALIERITIRRIGITRRRQYSRRDQQSVRVEPGIDGEHFRVAPQQQTCAREQHDRQRDLRNDERGSQPSRSRALRTDGPAESSAEVAARRRERG